MRGKTYVLRRGGGGVGIDFHGDLNPEQLDAVTSPPGPVLCIAGAGTGKTRVVTYRVAWLLEKGASPESILLCTFTNKAAREMLGRVEALSGPDGRRVLGGTFHHIAGVILRSFHDRIGFGKNFGILDDADAEEIIASLVPSGRSAPHGAVPPKPEVVHTILGLAANTMEPPASVVGISFPYLSRHIPLIESIAARYEARKAELNVMDFDGMLTNLVRLLEENSDVRETLVSKYAHVLVDEYQDTSRIQGRIVSLLSGDRHDLMAVGDDAQSIYSFRGATIGNMLGFPGEHPGCRIVTLKRNYRSTPQILDFANRVIRGNARQFQKELAAVRSPGPLPVLTRFRDGDEQAAFVAQRIKELVDEGTGLSDIAVLYRAHSHSIELQVELAKNGIPFVVRSGVRFFEQAHIKDALSILRFAWNPCDEIASARLLKQFQGIGNATAAQISSEFRRDAAGMPGRICDGDYMPGAVKGRAAQGWSAFREAIRAVLGAGVNDNPQSMLARYIELHYATVLESRYPDAAARRDDLDQLVSFAARYRTLGDFMNELSLLTSLEVGRAGRGDQEGDEYLTLSSVHQAKGLEWKTVFVLWLADGRFPSSLAVRTLDGEEEERRLFYVAATRAKDQLYLCQPMSMFTRDRDLKVLVQSRFLSEIPDLDFAVEHWIIEDPV